MNEIELLREENKKLRAEVRSLQAVRDLAHEASNRDMEARRIAEARLINYFHEQICSCGLRMNDSHQKRDF